MRLLRWPFALLALVIWRNSDQINKSSPGRWTCGSSRLAFLVYHDRPVLTFVRWFMLVRVIEPDFKLSSTLVLGSIGMVFNLVIPGGVGGDLIKAVLPRPDANQENPGHRVDGDRPHPGAPGPVHSGGRRRRNSPGAERREMVRTLAVLAWLAVLRGRRSSGGDLHRGVQPACFPGRAAAARSSG